MLIPKKPLMKKKQKTKKKKFKKRYLNEIRNNEFINSLTKTLENSIREDDSTKKHPEYGQKLNEFKTGKFEI